MRKGTNKQFIFQKTSHKRKWLQLYGRFGFQGIKIKSVELLQWNLAINSSNWNLKVDLEIQRPCVIQVGFKYLTHLTTWDTPDSSGYCNPALDPVRDLEPNITNHKSSILTGKERVSHAGLRELKQNVKTLKVLKTP